MQNLRAESTDYAPLRGDVTMYVRDAETGELLERHEIRNTITYLGMTGLIRLLAQNGVTLTDYGIAQLRVGTGTTAPTRVDTNLVASVFSMTLTNTDRFESISTGELIITKTLGAGSANGSILTEAGLFLSNGDIFARQIHPAITKSALITVTYEWRISFTS